MASQSTSRERAVYLVAGKRTPFLKAKSAPNPFSAADLGFLAARDLLMSLSLSGTEIDEVITGSVMPNPDEANISRIISLRLGCGNETPAWTVQRNCGSGLQAIDNAWQDIAMGRHDMVLAGGTEAMSHAPLLFNDKMVAWFAQWMSATHFIAKFKTALKFRPSFLMPVIALLKGLTDPLNGLSMGQTAENLAYKFGIDRQAMDEFAVASHLRATAAIDEGRMQEVMTLYDSQGNVYDRDTGVRSDSKVEKLATLKPFFDKKFGMVTAANSSQVTDGAAFVLLANAKAVKKHKLPVMAKIIDCTWAGLNPEEMGLGPAHAIAPLLQRNKLAVDDIDFWEINEAFAAQVIACIEALADANYCKTHLHQESAVGRIDLAKLNVDGGAVALGPPVGASGARILLHLAQVLEQQEAKRGVASLCIGGGQGGAMLIERVTGVNDEAK